MLFQNSNKHTSSFDLVDLKIRLPPHVAQRFSQFPPTHASSTAPQAAEEEPEVECKRGPTALAAEQPILLEPFLLRPFLPLLACLFSLVPLFLATADLQGPMYSGCAYLLFAPFTVPILVGFNLHHKNSHLLSWVLAYLSLLFGNIAAVLSCSSSSLCKGPARLWMVSAALSTSAVHLLLLINKSNIILVMISTASAVIICCLVLIAPVLPSLNMAYKCYQSTSLAMLWLFWQATTTAR